MIGSRDVHEAVATAWDSADLDDLFTAYWGGDDSDDFLVLNDQEAAPEQPFPYCIFNQEEPIVVNRMSGTLSARREVRDIIWEFRVYAKTVDSTAAKDVAGALAEEIMKVFGGHPTETPSALSLDTGQHLITQYLTDYGMRLGDSEHYWLVRYLFRVDVPVAQ